MLWVPAADDMEVFGLNIRTQVGREFSSLVICGFCSAHRKTQVAMSQFCGSDIFLAFDPQNLGVTLMTLAEEEPYSGCSV